MATYVFSDVHGHIAPLRRIFERVSPSESDRIFMLGDMIDRGPDPLGVLRFCRQIAEQGNTVLMGNHEDLMISYYNKPWDPSNLVNWFTNGGTVTRASLKSLSRHEFADLLEWVHALPLSASAQVSGRLYLFSHAGIRPLETVPEVVFDANASDAERIDAIVSQQSKEDLVWIRQEFWGRPTGLVRPNGTGVIVVAGHTPTPYLDGMADRPDRSGCDERGLGQMVRVGACDATGGIADRWDIDAGCAGGHGFGRLLLLRLDDGREFYEDIGEGE